MSIISNHYGRKCLSILLLLKECNDVFKVISDIMAQWYEMINRIIISINFYNGAFMFIITPTPKIDEQY